jgi:hypothetical protein
MDHLREGSGCSTTTEHSKGQNEDHDLGTTIERCRSNIVVLDEEFGVLSPQIPLSEETEEEEHADSRVDADEQIAHLPKYDGRVNVSPRRVWIEAVHEPEWDRSNKAEQIRDRDPLVFGTNREHLGRHTPGNGECVKLLDVLTGPNVGAENSC